VALDHRFLHRVQFATGRTQILDREERLAVERRHELDADIDRLQFDVVAVQLAHDDGARTAIALGAAFLRARTPMLAQPLENALRRVDVVDRDDPPSEHEADAVGAGICCCISAIPSASPVGRVAPGRHQQRHVIVLAGVGHADPKHDVAEEGRIGHLDAVRAKYGATAKVTS
jgi:hypothetical protein